MQLATTNNNDGTFTVDVLALATSQRPVQGRSRSFPGTFEVSIRVKETAAGAPPPCGVPLWRPPGLLTAAPQLFYFCLVDGPLYNCRHILVICLTFASLAVACCVTPQAGC